jgi:hypothetical protein
MRWMRREREARKSYNILVRNLKGLRKFEDLSVDGRIILKWILKILADMMWTGLI